MSSSNHPPKSLYSLRCFILALAGGLFLQTGTLQAQIAKEPPSREEKLEKGVFVNFLHDEKDIVTSPLHLHKRDLFWLVPTAAITGEMLHRDAYLYRKLTPAVNTGSRSKTFTDAAVVGMGGAIAGMYFLGRLHQSDHMRETSVLATEALADSMAFNTALKYSARRERPFNGNGRGDFFVSGGDSFASGHSIAAWSMATVVAQEYPGILTKLGAYGLATVVSVARVTGRQHFPTDVVVGSALGYGIGRMVYRNRHDQDLPGEDIGTVHGSANEGENDIGRVASPYVPLESWVYPALERLAGLGLLDSDFAGMRPWTRLECYRLTEEAAAKLTYLESEPVYSIGFEIIGKLRQKFLLEDTNGGRTEPRQGIYLDSVYARYMGVSGVPLADGYHFGQTVYNDYGRPVREGSNIITGLSVSASHGRWTAYLRGEYQSSPAGPSITTSTRQEIANMDRLPIQPSPDFSRVSQMRFLDAYVAVNLNRWQLSVGKQSLWWAPNESGSLMFTNNAEPILMARLNRVTPAVLPGFLAFLGPLRTEFFLGQLSGIHFIKLEAANGSVQVIGPGLSRQPFLDGAKLSFKPTSNFEFSVSVTTVFAGSGVPITAGTFLRSLSLFNSVNSTNDPGDRRAGFDFKYRIPSLRNWLTLYNDSMAEDEISPIAYPRRSAMQPGLYLSHVPKLPKLDMRAEGVYTDLPGLRGVGVYYNNGKYADGYRNRGNLLGHWVGRQGSGVWLRSTYWVSGTNNVQVGYRNAKVSSEFLTGGGRISDYSVQTNWTVAHDFAVQGSCQVERWNLPVLAVVPQFNVVSRIELRFQPRSRLY